VSRDAPRRLPELPILDAPAGARPSRKSAGRWRVAVLVGVHVLIALHVAHYVIAGRTISPVEPSETMYALELGLLNAGCVFFVVAILSTVLLGRFFCGWGCHLVALQDLCGAMMRRIGIRPRPLRSRLLLLAPVALAAYMFAWPTFKRVVLGGPPFPGWQLHLTTTEFWRTFPGPVFAVLTLLTCGFVAVYMLGSKGFCTYGCPYGAFFSFADRLAPVRIVAEGCQQSGQCTPACTSNVLVHLEVKRHSMVVDSGCMKCMDCVAACPNEALSVGFAKPSILVGRAASSSQGWIAWPDELLVAFVALVATLAFRGLYDGPPLLMAVALGGISAFVALELWHLARRDTVRLQSFTLRAGGETSRAGRAFLACGTLWMIFVAHSAFVQWHRVRGAHELGLTEVSRDDVLSGRFDEAATSPAHRRALDAAYRHLSLANRLGLARVSEIDLGLAWCHLLRGEEPAAETLIRDVISRDPSDPVRHDNLVELLVARGRLADAATALATKMAQCTVGAEDHFLLGTILADQGKSEDAVRELGQSVAMAPDNPAARYNLGAMLRRVGRPADAVEHLRVAASLAPDDADTQRELQLAESEAAAPR
jgi:tetratricopeptide (TPR) repeat protein/ferredoxin